MTGYESKKAMAQGKLEDDDDIQDYKKPWVGLTDGDIAEIYNQKDWDIHTNWDYERAIEAKLKDKNNG
jgi:hypothetical protein